MRWTALLLIVLLAVPAFAEVINVTVIEEVVVPASAPLVEDALDLFVDDLLNVSNSSEEQFIVNSSVSELNASIIDEVSSEVVEVISEVNDSELQTPNSELVVNDSITASVSLNNSSEPVSPAGSEVVALNDSVEDVVESSDVEVIEEVVSSAVAPLADQVLDEFVDDLVNVSNLSDSELVVNDSVTASVSGLDNSSESASPAGSEVVVSEVNVSTEFNVSSQVNESSNLTNTTSSLVNAINFSNESVVLVPVNVINLTNVTNDSVILVPSNLTNSSNDTPQTTNLAVVDALGNVLDTDISVDGSIVSIDFINGPVESMSLVDVANGSLPRVDSVPLNMTAPEGSWVQIYAIDPTNTTFDYGVVEVVAKGESLFKCKDWNFDARSCFGEWVKVADDMVPGNTYYLEIDALDPAFGEIVATSAQHLDSNYSFVSDIFSSIESVDGVWSGPVRAGEFVRVEFEHDLEDGNVIDFLARDNGTVSYVEVYVANTSILVGRSGVAGIPELQYVTVSGLPEPTNLFDLKVVKLVVDVDDSNCEEADCNANTHAENALDGFLEFDFIHDELINGSVADGLIVYVESAVTTPRYRLWNGSNNTVGAELSASATSDDGRWTVLKANPQSDEFILGVLDASTNTSVQVYNSTAWSSVQNLAFDSPNIAQRSFDVAFEHSSGTGLVVYENSTAVNNQVAYRTWDGVSWSAESSLTTNASTVHWVKAVTRTGSDDIMVLLHDVNNDLFAIMWNGSGFENYTQRNITGSVNDIAELSFDFVWMGTSGDGLVVYSNSTTAFAYRTFNYSSELWSGDSNFLTLNSGAPNGMRLCGDPTSNYAGFVSQDTTDDGNFLVWNGSGVESSPAPPTEEASMEGNAAGAMAMDCAFESVSGRGVFMYVDGLSGEDNEFRMCTYNKTAWSNSSMTDCPISSSVISGAASMESFKLYPSPVNNTVFILAQNVLEDLGIGIWNTSTVANSSVIETSLECLNGANQCVDFAWVRASVEPSVSSPANQTVELGDDSSLVWTLTGTGGDYYVLRNGSLFVSLSSWTSGTDIVISPFNYVLGVWNYTLVYNDSLGNSFSSSAFVEVVDNINPSCDELGVGGGSGSGLTLATITVDGNLSDWAGVLSNQNNFIGDLTVLTGDPDAISTNDRDMIRSAFTYNSSHLFFYTKRTTRGSRQMSYIIYIDYDLDGRMESTDRVVKFVWSGTTQQFDSDLYNYVPVNVSGDVMGGDGVEMPGSITINTSLETNVPGGSLIGTELETRVTWSALGLSGPTLLNFKAASGLGSSTNLPSQLEDNVGEVYALNSSALLFRPDNEKPARNGTSVYYDHDIMNCGIGSEFIDLTNVSSQGWNVTLYYPNGSLILDSDGDSLPNINLSASEYEIIVVRIDVPANATSGTVDRTNVTANYSGGNESVLDTTSISDIAISPESRSVFGSAGMVAVFNFTVYNLQSFSDTILINATSSNNWTVTLRYPNGTLIGSSLGVLEPNEFVNISVFVTVPDNATIGMTDNTTILINSSVVAGRSDNSTTNITIRQRLILEPDYNRTVTVNVTEYYAVNVTNNWNETDEIDLSYFSLLNWSVSFLSDDVVTSISGVNVSGFGGVETIYVAIIAPTNVTFGVSDLTNVTGNSSLNASVSDTVTINSTPRGVLVYNDSAFTILDNVFEVYYPGDNTTAFAKGFFLTGITNVSFGWYDSNGTLVRLSPNITVSIDGSANDSLSMNTTSELGFWTVIIYNSSDYSEVVRTEYFLRDIIVPNVTGILPVNGSSVGVSTTINITANVTDNVAVGSVYANVTFPNGSFTLVFMNLSFGNTYNGSFVVPVSGTYNVTILANDTSNNANNSETTSFVAIQGSSNVSVSKSDSVDPVVKGSQLTYTIDVSNSGLGNASNVTVFESYPSGVVFHNSSPVPSSGNNTWVIGTVVAGSSTTVNITVNVSSALANGSVLNNTVVVNYSNSSGNFSTNDSELTTIQGIAVTVAFKSDSPDPVVRGSTLNYSILVNNTGDEIAYNVTLVESYPSGVSFVTSSPAPSSGNNTFSLGNLSPNQSTTVNISVTVGLNILNSSSLSNFVNVTFTNVSGANTTVNDSETSTVSGFPQVFFNISFSPSPVVNGSTLTKQIVINNTGDEIAYNISVLESYPSGVTFNGSQPVPSSGNNTFSIGNISPGGFFILNITLNVSAGNGSILNNSLNITLANNSGVNTTVTNSSTVTVRGNGYLVVSKSSSPDPVPSGSTLTYQVLVNNSGDDTAFNVTVIEIYPANVTFNGSSPAPSIGNNTFSLGNIEPNQTATVNITVNVSSAMTSGSLNNTVFVNTSNFAGVNSTFNFSEFTSVIQSGVNFSNITLTKSSSSDPVVRGGVLNYTITVNSSGNDTAYNVTVLETYPVGVSFVTSSPAPSSGNNSWNLGNISNGTSTTINISLTVGSNVANGTLLNNTAGVNWSQSSGSNSTGSGSEQTTVVGFAALLANKTASPSPGAIGNALVYQILVNNTGDEIAYNVTIVESYPENISFISSSPVPTSGNNTWNLGNIQPNTATTINITVNVSSAAPNGSVLSNAFNVTFANSSGQNLTFNGNGSNTTVVNEDEPPEVVITSPGTFVFYANDTVNITANVTDNVDVHVVTFNVTYPDGSTELFNTTETGDFYNLSFINLTLRGNYSVRVIANDTSGNLNTSVTVNFTRVSLNIIDVVNLSRIYLNYTVEVVGNASGLLNLTVNISGRRIHQVNLTLHDEDSFYSILRIDDETNESLFREYAIDPVGINFTNATAIITAVGDNILYKCVDYDFENRECNSSNWSQYLNLTRGQNYTISFTNTDPGFLETSLAADVDVAPINFTTFVVGFVDVNDSDVSFRIMNTNGSVIVDTVDVDTTADNVSRVSVAVKNTTHFVISWVDGPSASLNYQIFNFSGQNETNVSTIDPTIGLNTDVDVAEIGDRFSVCYANDDDNDADFQEYFNNGTQAVAETAVDTNIAPGATLQNLVSCYAINGTRWTYFWFDDQSNDVSFAVLDQAGTIVTGPTTIDAVGETGQVAVTTINRNESAFVFYDATDADITITVRDAAGTVVLANTDIDTDAGAVSRVGIATVWRNDTNTTDLFVPVWYDNTSNVIRAAVYERNGTEVTAPFVVSSQPDATFRLLEATGRDPTTNNSLCPGTFVVAFSNSSGSGEFLGFYVNGTSWDGTCDSTLSVTKTDTPDPVVRGSQLNYSILISNSGELSAFNITAVESYPSDVVFDSSSPVPSSGNDTWTVGNLSPGNSYSINITLNVSSSAANGTLLNNTVNATFFNFTGENRTVNGTAQTTVQGIPVTVAIKSDTPDPVLRGQTLNYSILVNNTGDEIAYNVTLVEVYPGSISFVTSSPAPSSGNDTFSLGNLSPNQSTTVNISVTVGLNTANGSILTNFVNVTFANLTGVNSTVNDSENTTVIGFPEIFTNKSDSPDPVSNGSTLSYQILINNTGDEIAYNVTVVESYPANVTFNGSTPVPSSGNGTWSLGNLLPNTSTTINITVNVSGASVNGEVLNNSFNVTFANFSGTNLTVTNSTNTTVLVQGVNLTNVTINKSDNPDPVLRGTQLNYTLTINNSGNGSAVDVIVVEDYPSGVVFHNSSPSPSSGNNTWNLGNLSPNQSTTINITVNVSSSLANGTILNNTVNVSHINGTGDNETSNDSELTTVRGERNLTISKTDSPDPVTNGSTLSYQILINNTGDDTAFNVTLIEIYPSNVTFNGSTPVPSSGNNTWSLGNLEPNQSTTVNITVNVSGAMTSGQLNNSVFANASNFFGTNQTVNDSELTTVIPGGVNVSNITLTKTDTPDPVVRGQTLNYSILVNSTGNTTALNVVVTETYPSGVSFVSASPAPDVGNNTWNLGNITNGSSTTINISLTVGLNVANGTLLNNTVTANWTQPFGTNSTSSDTEQTTVSGFGEVFFNISATPNPVVNGSTLTKQVIINNTGDEIAYNVTVLEIYPSGVVFNGSQPAPSVGNNTFSLGNILPGGFFILNITLNVSAGNGTVLNNTINITFANNSGVNTTVSNSSSTTVRGIPVTVAIKTDSPDPVVRGNLLNYSILVNNTGDEIAYNVTLVEGYPANVSFVSASPSPSSGNNTWNLGNLIPNQSTTVNVQVNVSPLLSNGSILTNNVNVTFANLSGVNNTVNDSENTTVIADNAPVVLLVAPANRTNTTNMTILFYFNATDDVSAVLNCSLNLNGTVNTSNITTINSTVTNFTVGSFIQGNHSWNVTCTDLSNNTNSSENRTFTVDFTPPDFNSLTLSPDTPDALDPGVQINFTANVTDNFTAVDTVVLHVLLNNASVINITMTFNSTTGFFNASFTPAVAGNYSFFLTANDTVGNNDTSVAINRTIEFESTWTRSPANLGSINFAPSQNTTFGTITINNTGDFPLSFNLTSTFANTTFNESSFNLSAGAVRLIQVNVTAPPVESVTPFNITISSNGTPSSNFSTGTIVVTSNAFLSATFSIIPSEVTQGQNGVTIEANVTNIGAQNASNVSLNIVLPSDWVLTGGSLSGFFADIEPNESEFLSITVAIPSGAITGFRNVTTYADGVNDSGANLSANNLTTNTTEQVLVKASAPPFGPGGGGGAGGGGGGGGSGGGGGGPSSGAFKKTFDRPVLVTNRTVDVIRGEQVTFGLEVTNVYNSSIMTDVSLKIDGYLSRYVSWFPDRLYDILYGQSKYFYVTMDGPAYADKSEVYLTFVMDAILESPGVEFIAGQPQSKMFTKEVVEYITVQVKIRELTEESAVELATEVDKLYDSVIAKEYPHSLAQELFNELNGALDSGDFESVPRLTSRLRELLLRTLNAGEAIDKLKQRIAEAVHRGIDVSEAEKVLALALKAFEREDFERAASLALSAMEIELIETKRAFNLWAFVINNWWALSLVIAGGSYATYLGMRRAFLAFIRSRLISLIKEQAVLLEKMRVAQEASFVKKEMSSLEYYAAMHQYEARLEKIRSEMAKLRVLRARMLSLNVAIKFAGEERVKALGELRSAQEDYYIGRTLSGRKYRARAEELRLLVAELDASVLALKERVRR